MIPLLLALAVGYAHPEQLVETDWVAAHAGDANVRVVDMRSAATAYPAGHVPGAVYLSPVAIRVADRPPTFLPTPQEFEALMAKLGIGDATRVVVYDERGGIYAARLWWILNYFGHPNVALMNGGWVKWTAEQRAADQATPVPAAVRFTARPQPRWVATAADVVGAIDKPGVKIVDARTAAEIEGKDLRGIKRAASSRPRCRYLGRPSRCAEANVQAGDELKAIYEGRGILASHEVIAYCQVGMRARSTSSRCT